ncbi:hypothetical protein AVEN_203752-1 [Araneus ventricosus]|uniref:Uncharacterized protein n=1 Tax=Araneus ventricosus TaxID=182803 RepID=A0A4Y2GDZ9_ARAVE|nr:hypothetical protein AVEN_203752-1 [Araneus ventricosus]
MAGLSSLISPLRVPLITTRPTAFSPFSQQQPAEIRPTSIEVAWPFTGGLGVRVLKPGLAEEHESKEKVYWLYCILNQHYSETGGLYTWGRRFMFFSGRSIGPVIQNIHSFFEQPEFRYFALCVFGVRRKIRDIGSVREVGIQIAPSFNP